MWKKASKKQKQEIVEACEGVPPKVELAEKCATMTRDERTAARRALKAPLEPPTVGASVTANTQKAGDETLPAVPSIEAIE
eukprot:7081967-Lingulodinium_polyedra.AAC.1